MKSLHPFLQSIYSIVLLLVIISGLINTEYFYKPTTAAYYGFCISALICVITPPPHLYLVENKIVTFKTPLLLFGLWCFYTLFHYFTDTGTLVFTIYSVTLFLLLFKATTLFSFPNFNFNLLFAGIAGVSSIESIYCIAQFLGWCKSHHNLFAVTGSWNNPNITALFLALTVPVFLFLFRSKYKKVTFIGFCFLLVALLLLKCRAAFIGAAFSFIVFYGLEYRIINRIRDKKNRTVSKALLIISLLIIVPVSSHLYHAKKDSADGRKFIWKVAAIMAFEKPITGYGYGHFEKEYNLYQANYIREGKATAEELANAGPVIMPHNEFFLNVVEGGSIGGLLILLFFGSLLFTIKRRGAKLKQQTTVNTENSAKDSIYHLSYAGVVAFIGMSMVNSTTQVVPVMCLLIVYAAIICSMTASLQIPKNLLFFPSGIIVTLSKITIISSCFYLLFLLYEIAAADRQNKRAKLLKESGKYQQALKIMPALQPYLKDDSHYWENYGHIYFKTKRFREAANCFKKAQSISSLPEFYIGAGKSFERLKQYPQAIQEYETLVALYPPKFLYRMMLLKAYLKNKDQNKAIALAQEIIRLNPKTPSEKANQYKNKCRALLQKLAPETLKQQSLF